MRRLPPLHALRAFEAAARHLHFSKAAEELNLTPTAVSHQVRHLEDILGVTLFHRYPRPVRLSPEGEAFYPVLREALDRIAAAVEDISAARLGRPLTVSVTMAFASRWLTPRLPRLRAETGLSFAIEAEDRPVDLHASDVDIAIRYSEAPGQGAEWVRLFDDRIVPVCAPRLVEGLSSELDPREVAGLPLIHYRWRSKSKLAPSWERWFARAVQGVPEAPVVQTFSEEVHAIDAAVAGQGVVLASEVLVSDLLARGELIRISQVTLPGLVFWGVFLNSNPRVGELQLFMDWMRERK
ncbi:LysR substrate-binding domain-containing protein [Rhizobium sp. LCM 4573]|uniref:LysR substrate-binding domain-containing protein n=1 Tax=Rhizobium sp. LCM 4573 TaxID=1848291 RepID=UPI0008DA4EB2|nr:LysR substrate-binding domain-containing protein [Rhizobium sp. LCM 4573]OHV75969.1 LysR family transcriptional regulator [Rhizobium sp. LCM 4573]